MKDIDRLLVNALREEPSRGLPMDFAARVTALAAASEFSRFERWLMIVLVGALGVCVVMVMTRFGSQWLQEALANRWILAFAACAGASWLIGRGQRRALE